jgi:nucleoside-diphosphate-sugar epimerase
MTSGPVLVTGATGFIGRHLVERLRSAGYTVSTHSSKDGDIARQMPDVPGVRHVFHLAGKSFVPDSWRDPPSFYAANVLGTINVLDLCRRSGASLTYVSSYVYGRPERLPIDEEHTLHAVNPYAHTKILAEEACRFYSAHHGVATTIVRPFNIYGPGQDARFLIPILVRQALDPNSEAITVADDRPKRDYLYISDLVDLLLATKGQSGGVFNAGSGRSIGVGEIVALLNRLTPRPKRLTARGEARTNEILDVAADIRKAGRELGWRPQVDFASGLRLVVEHELAREQSVQP